VRTPSLPISILDLDGRPAKADQLTLASMQRACQDADPKIGCFDLRLHRKVLI
jgi:hypothetical protein